ncbi:hypothetical protein SAMN05216325_102157 [Nitrosomonas marina]|uniref:Uncharacterized protein n=1 Tax=Nitrosomonas marina TaxID=917 RepID=A0A1H8B8K7_9PROT|nr:hypothetical protein SAMN05216325_102157 [Nitrosomonas marina]
MTLFTGLLACCLRSQTSLKQDLLYIHVRSDTGNNVLSKNTAALKAVLEYLAFD